MKTLKKRYGSKGSGFTLVELVIVIAIVIVLSVVSVPIYRSYVEKAKYTEAYALLGTILSAQKAYYSEYGNFLQNKDSTGGVYSNCDPVLGIDIRGNKYFTWFFAGSSSTDPKIYFYSVTRKMDENLAFALQYNITKGAKIIEYSKYDRSWEN